MGFSYFEGKNWEEITRDERFFCAHLYFTIKNNPSKFIDLLNLLPNTNYNPLDEWEVAYEVCFYRDYLKSIGMSVRDTEYSDKRTFDLCMFSENRIVIIEAKAHEGFKSAQITDLKKDIENIRCILGIDIPIDQVALASSRYFKNGSNPKQEEMLKRFGKRHLTWLSIYRHYRKEIFLNADRIYKN